MTGDRLDAAVDRYLQAAALNGAPPPIPSDPLVDGETPIEQLLRVLGLATNTGDPDDSAESAEGQAQRDIWTTDAAGSFAAQDAGAASQLGNVAGIAGMVTGAVAGVLQPMGQIPQQLAQGAQQAIQAAGSLIEQTDPLDTSPLEDPVTDSTADSVWDTTGFEDAGDPMDSGGPGWDKPSYGGPAAGSDDTAPTAALGPAPLLSPATYPSSSPAVPVTQAGVGAATPAASPAMTGMPMVPPTGLPGAGAESKAGDTKRVAVPTVRNGTPVQGRINTAISSTQAAGPVVTTRIEGKPVAARRIRTDEATGEPR
ncbi:MAG: hypothetical protein ACOYBX_09775 [Mycobacterium sp.]